MRALEDFDDTAEQALWADACLAAHIFALLVREGRFEKAGLLVKGQAGPVRDLWLDGLKTALADMAALHQVPANVSAERLLGGLDLNLTLSVGKPVAMSGLLSAAHENILFLPMATLAEPETLRCIAAAMDSGDVRVERDGLSVVTSTRFAVLCFDESDPGEDAVSPVLSDRLMLHVDLRAVSLRTAQQGFAPLSIRNGVAALSDEMRAQLCQLPQAFGLTSLRPPLQMTVLARILCRMAGDVEVTPTHVAAAVRLGLVHRALQLPTPPEETEHEQDQEPPPPQGPPKEPPPEDQPGIDRNEMPEDMILDAAAAALPPGLLAYLKAARAGPIMRARGGRRGAALPGARKGRPLTSRKGALRAGKRLDLIATLRAAAPWQSARKKENPGSRAHVQVRASDFHIRRTRERSQTSTIFVVDASGSTALNRLSEAKGAIELLLGESYARRDHVALISFRGRGAQVLLPPTRALARAKKSLAALPGGGGTPLACGIGAGLALAEEEWKRGREPSLVLMTDGSANVDASGAGGRAKASEDAAQFARMVALAGLPAIVVDIGRQPQEKARQLAADMRATYLAMPFAQSQAISAAVQASL